MAAVSLSGEIDLGWFASDLHRGGGDSVVFPSCRAEPGEEAEGMSTADASTR